MTIQKAIRSGKPFKRKKHGLWFEIFHDIPFAIAPDGLEGELGDKPIPRTTLFSKESLLATDWEVKK